MHERICPSVCFAERLWVPSGPADGWGDAGGVLHHGLALVRSRHGPVHLTRQQPEAGVGELGSRRAASLLGHQRAEAHWPGHLPAHGLLCIHDWSPAGQSDKCAMLPPSGWDSQTVEWHEIAITFELLCDFVYWRSLIFSSLSSSLCRCCMVFSFTWELLH